MNEILSVDIGHLISKDNTEDFISGDFLADLLDKYNYSFEEVRLSLENKTSPITRIFSSETALSDIKDVAESLRGKYENILILGIGGSTLGFRAILQSQKGPFYNFRTLSDKQPRVFVLDNVDPILASHLGNLLDFRKTALVYISKSGSTPEPAANFIYFYKKYKEANGHVDDMVIICDKADNGINNIAKSIGCNLLHIPNNLPGRYSVLSSAGCLPCELIGIGSKSLLDGAAMMHNAILRTSLHKNPVFILAACLVELAGKGKTIHVLFNYSNILSEFGLWFSQLWAESLGKKTSLKGDSVNAGTTPLPALGATDQHSLLQLFKEGPNDKVFGFVSINDFPSDVNLTSEFPDEVEYSYFAGHTMSEQLKIEQISTEMSLKQACRPCYRLILPDISPFTLGALFYFMESFVIATAKLWQVNPFDQPGVEEGKNATYSLMGRQDYTDMRPEYEKRLESFNKQNRTLRFTKE